MIIREDHMIAPRSPSLLVRDDLDDFQAWPPDLVGIV